MKAKPQGLIHQETGNYECLWCETIFSHKEGEVLLCQNCGNKNPKDLIPIYVENDPAEMVMYTSDDFHGG